MNSTYIKAVILFGILCTTILRCFHISWNAPPHRWDEQTNIQVISELQNSKNPIFLTYNHKPFFEKPPIWYVLIATISKATRISPLVAARLFSASSGFILILLSCTLAFRWWGFYAGVITWSVLISTDHLFVTNPYSIFSTHTVRSADSDIFFILLLLIVSVLCVSKYISRGLNIAIGMITGVAILTKGPLAIVPLIAATIIPHLWRTQKQNQTIWLAWVSAGLLTILWLSIMIIAFGFPFVYEYIGYHIFLRAVTPLETHNGPLLFYIQLLFLKPIFMFFEVYLISLLVYVRSKKIWADTRIMHVCVSSILLIIIPSMIQTKLAWYILPFYPYAALTIAGIVTTTRAFRTFSAKWI